MHDLGRFVAAQAEIYPQALAELRAGHKRGHWMWFIFPQIDGLGTSSTARHYAIRTAAEAAAYLAHPLLGPRLAGCAAALLAVHEKSASEILGFPDDLKLRSSATLFASVPGADPVFREILTKFFAGIPDPRTLEILG